VLTAVALLPAIVEPSMVNAAVHRIPPPAERSAPPVALFAIDRRAGDGDRAAEGT